jgi:hypothetical protein
MFFVCDIEKKNFSLLSRLFMAAKIGLFCFFGVEGTSSELFNVLSRVKFFHCGGYNQIVFAIFVTTLILMLC